MGPFHDGERSPIDRQLDPQLEDRSPARLPRVTLPLDAAPSLADEQLRPVWRRGTLPPVQSKPGKRFSPTDRVIAVAAGVAVGWVAGGAIGYKLTDNPDNPDDDTSGLRGVIVGAPLGAAVGAILGWRLTDK